MNTNSRIFLVNRVKPVRYLILITFRFRLYSSSNNRCRIIDIFNNNWE